MSDHQRTLDSRHSWCITLATAQQVSAAYYSWCCCCFMCLYQGLIMLLLFCMSCSYGSGSSSSSPCRRRTTTEVSDYCCCSWELYIIITNTTNMQNWTLTILMSIAAATYIGRGRYESLLLSSSQRQRPLVLLHDLPQIGHYIMNRSSVSLER